MSEHVQISELKRVNAAVKDWLKTRYSEEQCAQIWEADTAIPAHVLQHRRTL